VKHLATVLLCGWVMWLKTTEFSSSRPPVESWKALHSYDSLAKCDVMAGNMAVAIAAYHKEFHPKERYELRSSMILERMSADGNVESTEEHVCFPDALDPRPRFKE